MFRLAFDPHPDGAVIFSSDQRVIAANPAYCELTGYAEEELREMALEELSEAPEELVAGRLAEMTRTGSVRATTMIRRADGDLREISYVVTGDVFLGFNLAIVRDVTNERGREQDLALRAGVLDTLEAAVYALDSEGRITLWNRAAEEIMGFTADEAIGLHVSDLGTASDEEIDAIRHRVIESMRTDNPVDGERRRPIEVTGLRRRRDGTVFPSRSEITVLQDDAGVDTGAIVMLHDLGRENRSRSAGRDGRAALMAAIGRRAISGTDPADLLAETLDGLAETLQADFVASWRLDARHGVIALEHGIGWPDDLGPVSLEDPDARRILPESPVTLYGESDLAPGGLLGRCGVCAGIVVPVPGHGRSDGALAIYTKAHRRFAEAEVEVVAMLAEMLAASRARVRLARLDGELSLARRQASVGALIAGVAHDFNNMLSVMLGYARLMAPEAAGSELLTEGVAEIESAALRARRLSRSLVDLGKPATFDPEVIDVGAAVSEVGELLHRTVGEAIKLRVETRDNGLFVRMPPGELDRAVVNLIANSRDAMPDGGEIVIRVGSEWQADPGAGTTNGFAVIEVVDSGTGMERDVVARALEPAFTTKERGAGSGIGLATVNTIMIAAGGEVEIESRPGEGTTVSLRIPLARPDGGREG